jgi:IS30 family transposase
MKREYTQLTEKERQEIARLHLLGHSNRAIGRWLSRAHSTVWRELHRQPQPAQRYYATAAEAHAQRRRHQRRTARKLTDPLLRQSRREQLARGDSPEAIAGQLCTTGHGHLSRHTVHRDRTRAGSEQRQLACGHGTATTRAGLPLADR